MGINELIEMTVMGPQPRRRFCLYLATMLLWFCVLPCDGEAQLSKRGALLAPPRRGFPPWYERLVCFTNWPDKRNLLDVGEVSYAQVLRDGVLEKKWDDGVVRVPEWIGPLESVTAGKLDAYLYRQTFNNGTLHICDTRPFLTVAFSSPGAGDFLKAPNTSLARLTAMLLKVRLPEGTPLRIDEATGFAIGHARFNVSRNGHSAMGRQPENANASSFSLCCYVSKHVIVYEFQKFSVPGCELDPRIPLFRSTSAPPTDREKALALFESLHVPAPKHIPKLVKALNSLPQLDPKDQRDHPYEFFLLAKCKYTGYDKLITAVNAATRADEVPLIAQALDALPKERDLRGKATDIQRAAIESLRKIGTPEAMEALAKVAETAVKPNLFEESTEAILKSRTEPEARRRCLEEARKRAENPDAEPEKLAFYLRGLGRPFDPPEVKVLRQILRRTKNDKLRARAIRQLSKWISDDADSRRTVLHDLSARLGDPNRQVRQDALRALGQSGDVRRLKNVAPLLDDGDVQVREAAAKAVCCLLGWPRPILPREAKQEAGWMGEFKRKLEPVLAALQDLQRTVEEGK